MFHYLLSTSSDLWRWKLHVDEKKAAMLTSALHWWNCCLHRSEWGWNTFAFPLKHLLPGVGCWGKLLFLSDLCEDPAYGAAPLKLVFPFFGGSNILIFCWLVCDFLRAEFIYCYGFRSKETKAVENIDQSSDLYQSEKTTTQIHTHKYTVPTHIGSNILVNNEEVWNIIKL